MGSMEGFTKEVLGSFSKGCNGGGDLMSPQGVVKRSQWSLCGQEG